MAIVHKIHPSVGVARVGDSEEFYIAPVTAAGTIEPGGLMGGLPIKPGTEDNGRSSAEAYRVAAGGRTVSPRGMSGGVESILDDSSLGTECRG